MQHLAPLHTTNTFYMPSTFILAFLKITNKTKWYLLKLRKQMFQIVTTEKGGKFKVEHLIGLNATVSQLDVTVCSL